MKKIYNRKFNLRLLFTTVVILSLTNVYAQPADTRPFIKYIVNNYSSLAKTVCDSCPVGSPLIRFRPIPFPEAAAIQALTGVNLKDVPGIAAPNFLGGGSPEIKGLVKTVAGMTDFTASNLRNGELLYFKNGAKGVAISSSGNIYTSSLTVPLGPVQDPATVNGFFSFRSAPRILPLFNATSNKNFEKSPAKLLFKGKQLDNPCPEVVYFAVDPTNEKIVYASLRDPANHDDRLLVKKDAAGTWELLDWAVDSVLKEDVWGALTVGQDGNLYIADPKKHVIVKATFAADGTANSWQVIAGTFNSSGFNNDTGRNALFNHPSGICINNAGNIYIADSGNNVIRMIDKNRLVTTYAGDINGTAGFRDDQAAYNARFNGPTAVAYNEQTKNLYAVDFNNKLIREINKDQQVSTLAGNAGSINPLEPAKFAMQFYYLLAKLNLEPSEAKFDNPTGIAIDPSGNGLYVSDGNYIKYVNTYPAQFIITSSFRSPGAGIDLHGLPILPLGLSMNSNNGAFYGIPLVAWEPTTYSISVINSQGASLINGVITIEVLACPKVPDTVIDNRIITVSQLPYKWNNQVLNNGGTTIAKLQSSVGCDSIVILNLSVKPKFNYNSEPYLLSQGVQINPIIPTTAGSKIDTYSISPALPAGLTLDPQTGIITGTPTTTTGQLTPAIGPRTALQYPAPWSLKADRGADLTQVKISDGNQKTVFENNSAFQSLIGSAGVGTGTPGAYTDFSGLPATKMYTNSPYSIQLSNTLSSSSVSSLNSYWGGSFNFMNSYAVYIDYNRDGNFEAAGDRAYISAAPQTDAHTEIFNLKIPVSAKAGITKMRIYCVEAKTDLDYYYFFDANHLPSSISRTTEQALSFYPFFNNISTAFSGENTFHSNMIDYGEFEDYNIDIVNSLTQSYVVTGSNQLGSDQSTITLAINKPTSSTSNVTICSTELPYSWNGLTFSQAGTQTAHLINLYGGDSATTLNLTVKQASSSVVSVANCGQYTYLGTVYTNSGDYPVHIPNAIGCDSAITFRFRQKATSSVTNLQIIPSQLPYIWNLLTFPIAGTQSAKLVNAEGCDSIATLVLKVQYNIYYPVTNTLEINKAIQPITPQIEGNYSPVWDNPNNGYFISPALPNGLQLNPSTGVITGTPTQLSPYKTYTVKLLQDGAKPATFRLSVGQTTTSTTTVDNCGPFTWNGVVYSVPGNVSDTFKNQYGFDSTATLVLSIRNPSATIIPLLVNKSELPYPWNGISITQEGSQTIKQVNALGCDSIVTVNVSFAPKVFYQSPNILAPKLLMAPIAPQENGGLVPSVIDNVSTFFKTNFLSPISFTIDAQNNSYVSDELLGRIYKISRGGILSIVDGFGTTNSLLAIDKSGNIYAADRITNRILKRDTAGIITTLADASSPTGIAVDGSGNVYFSEGILHRIRKISSNGTVSTLAGGTSAGYANGNGTAAQFNTPSGLSVDQVGNVFVADLLNNRIRKITVAGDVTSFAGNGTASSVDGSNSNSSFNLPVDISADNQGNEYVVEKGSSKIRKIDSAGTVSTLAGSTTGYQDGTGTQSQFNNLVGIRTDTHGQVYVIDKGNSAIRQINAINYTIQPSLVKGLQFDQATGIISGTPTDTLLKPATYTIHAFNKAGADSTKMILAICNPVATSFTVDTCNQYVWNDSIYTNSTTDTRTLKNRGGCDSVVTMHLIIRKGSTGPTTIATGCGSYLWYGVTYVKTGIYTKLYTNAVGCDSTIYLNVTINPLSANNLYVDMNLSDLPYKWRGLVFQAPGTQSIKLVNSFGCDSILSMTVRISNVLPNISYATRDTILYWDKKIDVPITMTNSGTAVPVTKIGEADTLINFSKRVNSSVGAGTYLNHIIKGPDGAYYATIVNNNQIYTLSNSGVWSVFAGTADGGTNNGPKATAKFQQPQGLAFDAAGNLYVGSNTFYDKVRKIAPDGTVSTLDAAPYLFGTNALAVDANNNLIIQSQNTITKLNLTTNQYVQNQMDYSAYFGTGELDMKTDSKGNIYILPNLGDGIVKIKPGGQMSVIGKQSSIYQRFQPGNGPDAGTPGWISGMAIDPENDNVYLMSFGQLLRVDTLENVRAVTGRWYDQWADQIFSVNSGQVSIINNYATGILYNMHAYGVGSIPFMDNYGSNVINYNYGKLNFKDFDKRIRLDSSGAIVGTPRGSYSSTGTVYSSNTSTAYTIVAANHYGIGNAPMVITNKSIFYKMESYKTTSFPFVWRGRSFNAATDTATYLLINKTQDDDTLYMLHLVYEGPPQPIISKGDCVQGQITLTANTAGKKDISFDGNNFGLIKDRKQGDYGLGYYNGNFFYRKDSSYGFNFSTSFEVWIKPTTVTGTQYIVTRDTVKTHGTFFGLSIQNGKFVYEVTKGVTAPYVDYKLTSVSNIAPNVWTHVATSYYDSTLHIYINGQLEGTLQTPENSFNAFYYEPGSDVSLTPDFFLGGLGHQFGFNGEMEEFRNWASRKDATAIQATMNSIVDPFSPSLALYYRFDGDVTDSANDISKSNRNATFIKPATSVSPSTAPINFASYKWMPGGAATKSIVANPPINTVYTLTVTDYKGTTGSDSLLVYPTQGPTVTAPVAIARTSGPSSCSVFVSDADLGVASAFDNCPGLILKRTGVPAGNIFPVGVTTITYTATSAAGRINTALQTVTITDNQPPTITSAPNQTQTADAGFCSAAVSVLGPKTSDNCGVASVTNDYTKTSDASARYPVGVTTITWTVKDVNGNRNTSTQTVTVTDNEKPVIVAIANQSVTNNPGVCGAKISMTASATDNCGVGIPTGVRSDGLLLSDYYPVGITTITWTVTDIHSNQAIPVTRTVTVTDNEKPVVKTKPVTIYLDASGKASIITSDINNVSTDNCLITSYSLDKTTFDCSNLGANIVNLTVTDNHSNVASASAIVTIKDIIAPTVKVTPITVTLVNGTVSITPSMVDAGSYDNCSVKLSLDKSTFACANIGKNTIKLTGVDPAGNSTTVPVIVTVIGEVPGATIVSVPTSSTYTGGNNYNLYLGYGAQSTTLQVTPTAVSGNGSNFNYTYLWSGPVSSLNMLSSKTVQSPVFTPTVAGYYIFTVTVTNNYGCSTTATVSICVRDIRVDGSNKKVYLCHVSNGISSQTLSISVNAVPAHLGNHPGDKLGSCNMQACAAPGALNVSHQYVEAEEKVEKFKELTVVASPNPSMNYFRLDIKSNDQITPVTIKVTDAAGRPLKLLTKVMVGSSVIIGDGFKAGTYFAEIIQGNQHKVISLIKML